MNRYSFVICFSLLIVSLLIVNCLPGQGSLAEAANLGYIDVQKVFKGYKETTKAQVQLSKEEDAFKKEFEDSQKKIEEAKKKGKSEEEIKKLSDDLEKNLAPKREKLLKFNESLTLRLQKDIVKAVDEAAKTLGLDVVVDKQVVISGGMDLTEMVLSKLNK